MLDESGRIRCVRCQDLLPEDTYFCAGCGATYDDDVYKKRIAVDNAVRARKERNETLALLFRFGWVGRVFGRWW